MTLINLAAIVNKNQVNIIFLVAILGGGLMQDKAMASNIWLQEQKNARSSLYYEVSG